MFKRLSLVLTLSLFVVSFSANAGLLVEPTLGYMISGEYDSGGTTKPDIGGMMYGARAGYGMMGFHVGAEYTMASLTYEANSTETDYKGSYMGAFVSYEFPVMLRAWATYYFSAKHELDETVAAGSVYAGSGMGFGVGFTGLPFISINLEYRTLTFDELEDAVSPLSNGTLNPEHDATAFILSVSAPFDL